MPYGVCSSALRQQRPEPPAAARPGPAPRPTAAAAPGRGRRGASASARRRWPRRCAARPARRRRPCASTAATASASAAAVRVPGAVTSMSGTAEADARAPGRRARTARRRRRAGRRPDGVRRRSSSSCASHLAVPVDHALGRAGRAGGEQHGALGVVRRRRRQVAVAAEPGQVGQAVRTPRARQWRGVQRAGGDPAPGHPQARAAASASADADDVVGAGAAQGPAHARRPEPGVGDDDRRRRPASRRRRRGQVGAGRDEQRDPVARAHAGRRPGRRQVAHPAVQEAERACCGRAGPAPRPRASHRPRARRAPRPQRRDRPVGASGWSPARRSAPLQVARPSAPDVAGRARGVLGDQVRRALVPVHVGVRQPAEQVPQVEVGEHRVARAPEHQRPARRRGRARPSAIRSSVAALGWSGVERDVGDEVADRRRRAGGGVGRGEARRAPPAAARGQDSAEVARTNAGVRTQTSLRRPGVRASRISEGAAAPAAGAPRCW